MTVYSFRDEGITLWAHAEMLLPHQIGRVGASEISDLGHDAGVPGRASSI